MTLANLETDLEKLSQTAVIQGLLSKPIKYKKSFLGFHKALPIDKFIYHSKNLLHIISDNFAPVEANLEFNLIEDQEQKKKTKTFNSIKTLNEYLLEEAQKKLPLSYKGLIYFENEKLDGKITSLIPNRGVIREYCSEIGCQLIFVSLVIPALLYPLIRRGTVLFGSIFYGVPGVCLILLTKIIKDEVYGLQLEMKPSTTNWCQEDVEKMQNLYKVLRKYKI